MSDTARWYAVQTYSGHENKVKKLIDIRIGEEQGETPEEKQIQEALVPTQEVTEIRNGKRVQVTRRLYPGYVLVRMMYNQRTMHVINNIQGVIKFVGGGTEPQPLRDEEINKILGLAPEVEEVGPEEDIPFRPEQVVEVAVDGVQRSTRYPGGVALRFARVRTYRQDKGPDEADTIEAVQALAFRA